MKLIQLNIWGGKLENQIQNFLKEQDADIVCLQEVFDYDGHGGSYLGMLHEIAGSDYKNQFFAPTYSISYMNQEVDFGIAILSKSKIEQSKTIFTGGEFKKNFDIKKDDYNIRNFQHAVIDKNGAKINVINYHGYHSLDPNGNDESTRQLKIIVDYITKLSGPIILCGDFSLDVNSDAMAVFDKTNLDNIAKRNNVKSTLGELHYCKDNIACDYIFVSKDIKVESFKMSDMLVSDHKALILEFSV